MTAQEQTNRAAASGAALAPATGRGHLLPTLLETDLALYGRWDYLAAAWEAGTLPDAPIPRIEFLSAPDKAVWKMLSSCLDAVAGHGSGGWQGWSGPEYFRFFCEWLLYGFHHGGQPLPPEEPAGCEGAGERLSKVLDLALWQAHPYDYLGEMLAQSGYGKRQGFFPTPHTVCEFMTRMTMNGGDGGDSRILTVCDPCVGTGRLLLHASNYSLRLYGLEIDALLCQATLVNGFLFAPALVRPLPFLDAVQYDPSLSADIAHSIAAQAPPHIAERLEDAEHDGDEQWRFEPVKKLRRKDTPNDTEVRQGVLF